MINEQKLDKALLDCGLRDNLTGTAMIRIAIHAFRPGMAVTKELYPDIAKAVGSTPSRVERAMRHAIESGFDRCCLTTGKTLDVGGCSRGLTLKNHGHAKPCGRT